MRPPLRLPLATVMALIVLGVITVTGVAVPAAAAECERTPKPGPTITETPWPQATLWQLDELPAGITGAGVIVAVLDSGVDATHPQFRDPESDQNKVIADIDLLREGSGREDCVGHGTGVASLIVGTARDGVAFRGLAPGARIISARISEQIDKEDTSAAPGGVGAIADAVRWATANQASIINASLTFTNISEAELAPLRAAIDDAIAADIVVIAAVGNDKENDNPTPYPAAWPGVLGVGAISADGLRLPQSQTGEYVDIVAPGTDIITAWPGGGHSLQSGTSFAAPLVAATAALVRQAYPGLTAEQVQHRLVATADPAPGGPDSEGYGAGVVNPIRAVTELVDEAAPNPVRQLAGSAVDPAEAAAARRIERARLGAKWASGIAVLAAMGAITYLIASPAARRRRWRAPIQ